MGLVKAKNTNPVREDGPVEKASLEAADPAERRRAVREAAHDPEGAAELVNLLKKEDDTLVRQSAFIELATMNSGEAAHGLAELLSDADPALRNGALEALAAMPEHARGLLVPLSFCEDPDVRIFAIMLAAEIPGSESSDWLIAHAGQEMDANVCAHLAEVLGGTGREEALGALEQIAVRFAHEPFLGFAVETARQRIMG